MVGKRPVCQTPQTGRYLFCSVDKITQCGSQQNTSQQHHRQNQRDQARQVGFMVYFLFCLSGQIAFLPSACIMERWDYTTNDFSS